MGGSLCAASGFVPIGGHGSWEELLGGGASEKKADESQLEGGKDFPGGQERTRGGISLLAASVGPRTLDTTVLAGICLGCGNLHLATSLTQTPRV